jgi:hypothetical protein
MAPEQRQKLSLADDMQVKEKTAGARMRNRPVISNLGDRPRLS